jgi:MerR family transcriptional regulator, light-induced transcriptional regulator
MYTIKQAALRAGVSVEVLRAWGRRYGIVRPGRTASGYRLYDDSAIDRLRAMRQLIDTGWSASQAALEIEANGVLATPAALAGPGPSGAGGEVELSAAFVKAAAVLDGARIEAVLDELFAAGSFERVIDARVMPALRALGEAWAEGTVSVAAEHAASHAMLRRLSAAFEAAGRLDVEHPVLVGLPPRSRHELGALAFATAARRRGLGVVYLGADVPESSWIDAAQVSRARAVVIGIPTVDDQATARIVAEAMSDLDVLVAAGGTGVADADLPTLVMRLPDGIVDAAVALDQQLAAVSR